MSKRILFSAIAVLVVLALLAGRSNTLAQGPVLSGVEGPAGGAPQSKVSTAFTYQGLLQDGAGNPVNSTCDFTFSAWDALSGGTQVGTDCTVTGVQVVSGYFTAQLNASGEFDTAFQGDARWLQIAVQCTGDPAPTTLDPRQELTAAPYALSLRPGAQVTGAVTAGAALRGENTATSSNANGLSGQTASTDGAGVFGAASAISGTAYGVLGRSASTEGAGVRGRASATSGATYGVYGQAVSAAGIGVYGTAPMTAVMGIATGAGAGATGIYGESSATDGRGVFGRATDPSSGTGVQGWSDSSNGVGVSGRANVTSGYGWGVAGSTASEFGAGVLGMAPGTGVWGEAVGTVGVNFGVYGTSHANSGVGVYGTAAMTGVLGIATGASAGATGIYGESSSTDGYGVIGHATATSGGTIGVGGVSDSTHGLGVVGVAMAESGTTRGVAGLAGSDSGTGVYGESLGTAGVGVYGYSPATSGLTYGVYAQVDSPAGTGVYASAPDWAGWFDGNVHVNGTLTKNAGGFKIDDPLDPAHKYLYHSFVESPDMKNIYDGVVTLDRDGTAWVDMPAWFQAVNQDFRYQLTCIGGYAPVYVAWEIQENRFQIGGGTPGLKVSWQVTGIRHDPYAEAYRLPVEQAKPANEQGTYLHPELYGQSASAGVEYGRPAPAANLVPEVWP